MLIKTPRQIRAEADRVILNALLSGSWSEKILFDLANSEGIINWRQLGSALDAAAREAAKIMRQQQRDNAKGGE